MSKGERGGGSVRQLLRKWVDFVRQVQAGYDFSIYDYTNDLSARDLLEEKVRRLSPAEAAAVREELLAWDGRFEEATRPSLRPVAPGVTDREGSWWFRVPCKLSEELAADLRSEGVIP